MTFFQEFLKCKIDKFYITLLLYFNMNWKLFWSSFAFLILSTLLFFYFFFPYNEIKFYSEEEVFNFTLPTYNSEMQFYPNMRYPGKEISYKISDECTLKKKNDMEFAFDIIENLTVLEFYPVFVNEEISVNCNERDIVEGGIFIAGEGGPTKVVRGEKFNVILKGDILLIRDSQCEKPNIAIHELLHALGFAHSLNKHNVMYNVTSCNQKIGEDIPKLINDLYSYPSYSDLSFTEAHANIKGRYLNLNMTIKNLGLKSSERAEIEIYTNDNLIKKVDLGPVNIGEGKIITLENIWTSSLKIEQIILIINSDFEELEKENNKITLKIKNEKN